MITSKQQKSKKKQKGIALLVLVIALALTFTTYYFSSISIVEIKVDKVEKTQAVLKQAKRVLLDYAVTNWLTIGETGRSEKFPCTDSGTVNPAGEQEPICGNAYANAIGYFPWRTLGIDITKDSSGSCLMYAVSPAYKKNPAAALNRDSYGQFIIVDEAGAILQGASPEDRPVAVIVAPGNALSGQSRNNNLDGICGSDYNNVAAYLDNDGITDNAAINPGVDNVIERFVQIYTGSEQGSNPLNDRLITISHQEFWDAMQITSVVFNDRMKNLTEAIALCFAEYGKNNGNHLPMPAALNLNGGEYRKSSDYDDSGIFTAGFSGRLPYSVMQSNTELDNTDENNIFKNTFCDGLELVTTPGPVSDDIRFTDVAGGDQGEYFDLWTNWKDHFFYAISKAHNPNVTVTPCSGDCVSVNGIDYAGIVFFSGLKQTVAGVAQQRYAPPFDGALALDGVDDKDDVVNYLENGNDVRFPNDAGNETYARVTLPSNDIMFCIKPDMSVVECL